MDHSYERCVIHMEDSKCAIIVPGICGDIGYRDLKLIKYCNLHGKRASQLLAWKTSVRISDLKSKLHYELFLNG